MATIVNTPSSGNDNGGNGMGFLMGIILLILAIFLFLYYGLPAMRQAAPQQDINVEAPAPAAPSDVNVDVPDQIDVNVTNPQEGQ